MELVFIILGLLGLSRISPKRIATCKSKSIKNKTTSSPREYEQYCASLLNNMGYRAVVTPVGPDDGVDIMVYDPAGNFIGIAECKRWSYPVNVKTIKAFYATMQAKYVSKGWVFALNGFTLPAKKFVDCLNVEINLLTCKP